MECIQKLPAVLEFKHLIGTLISKFLSYIGIGSFVEMLFQGASAAVGTAIADIRKSAMAGTDIFFV